jgi:predicted RNase H-related nuclease YkuK (DUF458 family)
MIEKAREAITASSQESSIYIGSDSLRRKHKGQWYAKYSTCIIIHHDSSRGAAVYHETVELPDYGNMKQRLLQEVGMAIEAFNGIADVIGKRHCAIHLDLNPNPKHKSQIAVKEALGWVRGATGLEAVVKPGSFAASHCSDQVVKSKGHWSRSENVVH